VWSIIQAAGWPIWPLIFASIIALALIFERLWSLRQSVVAPQGLVDRVLGEYRQTGVTPELIAKTALQGPLGRILAAGLATSRVRGRSSRRRSRKWAASSSTTSSAS
jgi:biopolymer transport protein ExbB